MESKLGIGTEEKDGVIVVNLCGRLDAATAPEAEEQVGGMIDESHNRLLLDFKGIEYLSSAGMRMLLSTTKKLRGFKGQMVLCSVNDNVMDVFKMSGFDHLLEIAANSEEALARMKG